MKVPLYEDVAAITGIVVAAGGLILTQVTEDHLYDGLASIGIGVILAFVAWELGTDSRRLLIGEAILVETRHKIEEITLSFPEVVEVLRLLTMHLGPSSALMTAEINVVDGLDTDQIEDLLEDITRKVQSEVPEITQTFIELHPEGKTGEPTEAPCRRQLFPHSGAIDLRGALRRPGRPHLYPRRRDGPAST